MCETCTRPSGTLEEFRKAEDMLQGEEEKGEREGWRKGRAEERKWKEGDSWKNDRMGASFPPLYLRGESGKSRSSRARNGRSHFHVDKSVCLRGEAMTERGVRNTGVLSWRRKEICLGECASGTSTLTALKLAERVTSRRGVSLGCWQGRICQEHFWLRV